MSARHIRIRIDLAIPITDNYTGESIQEAFATLAPAVRTRLLALRNAIRDCWADARQLGVMERPRAVMHVCLHDPDRPGACGPETEIR